MEGAMDKLKHSGNRHDARYTQNAYTTAQYTLTGWQAHVRTVQQYCNYRKRGRHAVLHINDVNFITMRVHPTNK